MNDLRTQRSLRAGHLAVSFRDLSFSQLALCNYNDPKNFTSPAWDSALNFSLIFYAIENLPLTPNRSFDVIIPRQICTPRDFLSSYISGFNPGISVLCGDSADHLESQKVAVALLLTRHTSFLNEQYE